MAKSGRTRLYAIHAPAKDKGVHYNIWANVVGMAQCPGTIHRAFDDQKEAEYFVLHGHLKGCGLRYCGACEQDRKELEAQPSVPRHHQHTRKIAIVYPRPTMHFQEASGFGTNVKEEEQDNMNIANRGLGS
jgi:hypothetical protein